MSAKVIAIDGPAASGKSSVAKLLAQRLGIIYINTGSIYRAIAWKAKQSGIRIDDLNHLKAMLDHTTILYAAKQPGENPEIQIDGIFPGEELRASDIASGASSVAAIPFVRQWTLSIQRNEAKTKFIVMEGRDIGTAVFPDAMYKFFLTAAPRVRAIRRLTQGGETPDGATVDSVAAEIEERDKRDSQRAVAPLKQADDAIFLDNSDLDLEGTLQFMLDHMEYFKK